MKRKTCFSIAVLLVYLNTLTACGENTANNTVSPETLPAVTAEITTLQTESPTEEKTEAETTTQTTEEPKENIPDIIQAILKNDCNWQDFPSSYINHDGYSDVFCWFQDLDMDNNPEFIIGPMVSGAHAAHDYEIWTYQNNTLAPFSMRSEQENLITTWGNNSFDLASKRSDLFPFQLYQNAETGAYLYVSPDADGNGSQTFYSISKFDGTYFTTPYQITLYADGTEEYIADGISLSKSEFVQNYDDFFDSLIPYAVTVKDISYTNYLSATDQTSLLLDSYQTWQYQEDDTIRPPLNDMIETKRDAAMTPQADILITLAKQIYQDGSNDTEWNNSKNYCYFIAETSRGLCLGVNEGGGAGSNTWIYDENGNAIDSFHVYVGAQLYYDGTYYELFENVAGDGTRYVDILYPERHYYYQENIGGYVDETAPCTLDGVPIDLSEFNGVYEIHRRNSSNVISEPSQPGMLYYYHNGTYDVISLNS